jgi:hypothetical protein
MELLGAYVSVVDILMIVAGLIIVCLLYLAHEIKRLRELENKFEKLEKLMELDESELEDDLSIVREGKRSGKRHASKFAKRG